MYQERSNRHRTCFPQDGQTKQFVSDGLWCLEEGALRIKLEHVQSGERVQVESFDDAVAWVEARANSPNGLRRPRGCNST